MTRHLTLITAAMLAAVLIVTTAVMLRDVLTGNPDAFWWQVLALLGNGHALVLTLAHRPGRLSTQKETQ